MKEIKKTFFILLLSSLMISFSSCKNNKQEESEEPIIIDGSIPTFSLESGFYDNNQELTISVKEDVDVYYSLNPDCENPTWVKYTKPIVLKDRSDEKNTISIVQGISNLDVYYPTEKIDKCYNIQAYSVNKDGERSVTVEKNYFIGFQNKTGYQNMPIVNLSLDYDDLFDYEKGIYVKGKVFDNSPETTYPEQHEANYTQKGKKWERKALLTYYEGNHSYSFSQDIGVRIHGGWSRAFNQKSFNLYAREEYGNKYFAKNFFGGKEWESLKTCMLRSGGYRDTYSTKTRDVLNQYLSKDLLFETEQGYPVITFLNGEYWGIYNLQERFSDSTMAEKHMVNKDDVIIIQNDEIDEGLDEDISYYNELKQFFIDYDPTTSLDPVKEIISINGFINYMEVQLFIGNIDWPGNNVRLWRTRGDTSPVYNKWTFMMYDTDDSSNMLESKCSPSSNPFENVNHWKYGPLDDGCIVGLMFSKLIQNDEFKTAFKERYASSISGYYFSPYEVNQYLNPQEELLNQPMQLFYKRFKASNVDSTYFASEMNKIRDFYTQRKGYMDTYIDAL